MKRGLVIYINMYRSRSLMTSKKLRIEIFWGLKLFRQKFEKGFGFFPRRKVRVRPTRPLSIYIISLELCDTSSI